VDSRWALPKFLVVIIIAVMLVFEESWLKVFAVIRFSSSST